MNTARHFDQDDLALFAMQLLEAPEAAVILEHLEHCDECRRELAAVQGDLAIYAHTIDLHSPPALARERLLKQVGREKKIVPITRPAIEFNTAETTTQARPFDFSGKELRSPDPRSLDPRSPDPRSIDSRNAGQRAAEQRMPDQRSTDSRLVEAARPADATVRTGTTLGIESSYLRAAYQEEEEANRSFASKAAPWLGWAIAAGLAVTAGDFYQQRNALQSTAASKDTQLAHLTADAAAARQLLDTLNDTTALRVTLQKPQTTPVPQARATYVASKGTLLFIASNLEPLLPYKAYELWLIPADGRDPIPAGTFHPDAKGNASVIMPTLPRGVEAKAFGVTIEDEGGATTPTLPIILAGA